MEKTCKKCKGKGFFSSDHVVYNPYTKRNETVVYSVDCMSCGGTGKIEDDSVRSENKEDRRLE